MPRLTNDKIHIAADRVARSWWNHPPRVEDRERQIAMAKRFGQEATSFMYSMRVADVAYLAAVLCPSIAPSKAQLLRWAHEWRVDSMPLACGLKLTLVKGPSFELTGPHVLHEIARAEPRSPDRA